MEQYYGSIGKELLLESPEKTMTGMFDQKHNEYQLILSDNEQNEGSESNSIDLNDIQYNDQGGIFE